MTFLGCRLPDCSRGGGGADSNLSLGEGECKHEEEAFVERGRVAEAARAAAEAAQQAAAAEEWAAAAGGA